MARAGPTIGEEDSSPARMLTVTAGGTIIAAAAAMEIEAVEEAEAGATKIVAEAEGTKIAGAGTRIAAGAAASKTVVGTVLAMLLVTVAIGAVRRPRHPTRIVRARARERATTTVPPRMTVTGEAVEARGAMARARGAMAARDLGPAIKTGLTTTAAVLYTYCHI